MTRRLISRLPRNYDGSLNLRVLTVLPRRWRMTADEARSIEVVAGVAARRIKVPRSMARFNDRVWPVVLQDDDQADDLIRMLDGLREEYRR